MDHDALAGVHRRTIEQESPGGDQLDEPARVAAPVGMMDARETAECAFDLLTSGPGMQTEHPPRRFRPHRSAAPAGLQRSLRP